MIRVPEKLRARGTPGEQPRPRPRVVVMKNHTSKVTANVALAKRSARNGDRLFPCAPRRGSVVPAAVPDVLPAGTTGLAPVLAVRASRQKARNGLTAIPPRAK